MGDEDFQSGCSSSLNALVAEPMLVSAVTGVSFEQARHCAYWPFRCET